MSEKISLVMTCNLNSTDQTDNLKNALTFMQNIKNLDLNDPTDQELNSIAKVLLKVILFLSKDDCEKTLLVLKSMLANVDEKFITISTELLQVGEVAIKNGDTFRRITVTAIKHLLPRLNQAHVEEQSLLSVFLTLYNCIDIKSSSSVLTTQTVFLLVKKCLLDTNLEMYESEILSLTGTFASFALHRKASDNLNNLTKLMIRRWTIDKQKRMFDFVLNSFVWDAFNTFILTELMSCLDSDIILSFDAIVKNIKYRLSKGDLYHDGLNLLKVFIKCVDLQMCLDDLYPILMEEISDDGEKRELFVKTVLKDCAKIFVDRYGVVLRVQLRTVKYDCTLYLALNVFCTLFCVEANHTSVDTLQTELEDFYRLCEDNVLHHYIIKTACCFKDKEQVVQSWQLNLVNIYLKNLMFLPDSFYCLDDLSRLASQVCVRANCSNNNDFDLYVQFINDSYGYCMTNLKSKCPDRIKIGAELYDMLENTFTDDSNSLNTKYTLPVIHTYKKCQGPFYLFLVANNKWPFVKEDTFKCLYKEFHDTSKVYPQIPKLLIKWLNNYIKSDSFDFENYFTIGLDILKNKYDFEAVIKGYTYILLSSHNKEVFSDVKKTLIACEWEKTCKMLFESDKPFHRLEEAPIYGLTACIYVLMKEKHLVNDYITKFDSCINIIEFLLTLSVTHDYNSASACLTKAIELTIVTCFDIIELVIEREDISSEQRVVLTQNGLRIASRAVELGNMKRPVVSSATLIAKICSSNNLQVVKFHENVLNSINSESTKKYSKVRRYPEHRLVLHSIINANKEFTKDRLNLTMDYLIDILLNSNSSINSITSSLHTIEILVSDNTIGKLMVPYVEAVTKSCLVELSNEDWKVRNAALQVYQALVKKLLGQKADSLHRRNTIDDVFVIFPQLMHTFYDKLKTANIDKELDTIVGILTFFSEGHRKLTFKTIEVDLMVNKIICLLLDYVNSNNVSIGLYAAKAYAALYPHYRIPFTIRNLLEWLSKNFTTIQKNIFYAYYRLVQELKGKFDALSTVPYYDKGRKIIVDALNDFSVRLEKYNSDYESMFTSLRIRTVGLNEIVREIPTNVKSDTLYSRRWLKNNVFYALKNVEANNFCALLNECLSCRCMLIQEDCLRVIEERFEELKQKVLITNVLNCVLTNFFNLFNCVFLTKEFSYVIFLLLDDCSSIDFEWEVFNLSEDVYVMSVYSGLLSFHNHYDDDQKVFIKSILEVYAKALTIEDDELQLFISSTLKYLYKCVDVSDRHIVLTFAFVLLLNSGTSRSVCKFISSVFNMTNLNVRSCYDVLLSYDRLTEAINNRFDVCQFFNSLARFIFALDESYVFNNQFYLKQNLNICFTKHFIQELLNEKINEYKMSDISIQS